MNQVFFFEKTGTSKSLFVEICSLSMKISTNNCKSTAETSTTESTRKKHLSPKTRKKCPTFFQKSFFRNEKTTETTKWREAESFFVLNGVKEPLHHDKNIDHSIDLLHISTVSEHTCNLGEFAVASHAAM